ncbi:Hypothetical protein PBC10988_29150 [Planctomycetales bacterium 10988]|nr:Hypothetical protein PBC10988_29150 [Planctomycetales bacterium 10988]
MRRLYFFNSLHLWFLAHGAALMGLMWLYDRDEEISFSQLILVAAAVMFGVWGTSYFLFSTIGWFVLLPIYGITTLMIFLLCESKSIKEAAIIAAAFLVIHLLFCLAFYLIYGYRFHSPEVELENFRERFEYDDPYRPDRYEGQP